MLLLLLLDRAFPYLRALKSVEWRILCSSEEAIDNSEIPRGSVWLGEIREREEGDFGPNFLTNFGQAADACNNER